MNREIKFRAFCKGERQTEEYVSWCKEKKYSRGGDVDKLDKQEKEYETETNKLYKEEFSEMIYGICVSSEGKRMKLMGGCDYFGDDDDAIIMQYIGLKDKHGKDIYIGDIVKTFDGDVAEIKQGQCIIEAKSRTHNYMLCNMEGEDLVVIGNIYENSYLLTSNDKDD